MLDFKGYWGEKERADGPKVGTDTLKRKSPPEGAERRTTEILFGG